MVKFYWMVNTVYWMEQSINQIVKTMKVSVLNYSIRPTEKSILVKLAESILEPQCTIVHLKINVTSPMVMSLEMMAMLSVILVIAYSIRKHKTVIVILLGKVPLSMKNYVLQMAIPSIMMDTIPLRLEENQISQSLNMVIKF